MTSRISEASPGSRCLLEMYRVSWKSRIRGHIIDGPISDGNVFQVRYTYCTLKVTLPQRIFERPARDFAFPDSLNELRLM
jgi:hypothetical protein